MTRDDALNLIPPGWVECNVAAYILSGDGCWKIELDGWYIYAIPAPAPKEPRRVPMGEMVMVFDSYGTGVFTDCIPQQIRVPAGGLEAVANTKWRLDFDAREWVEVLDES